MKLLVSGVPGKILVLQLPHNCLPTASKYETAPSRKVKNEMSKILRLYSTTSLPLQQKVESMSLKCAHKSRLKDQHKSEILQSPMKVSRTNLANGDSVSVDSGHSNYHGSRDSDVYHFYPIRKGHHLKSQSGIMSWQATFNPTGNEWAHRLCMSQATQ